MARSITVDEHKALTVALREASTLVFSPAEAKAYISALESERDRLRAECNSVAAEYRDAHADRVRLRAELARVKRDADRYRWLLNFGSRQLWFRCAHMDSYDDVERAIDAALAGEGESQ